MSEELNEQNPPKFMPQETIEDHNKPHKSTCYLGFEILRHIDSDDKTTVISCQPQKDKYKARYWAKKIYKQNKTLRKQLAEEKSAREAMEYLLSEWQNASNPDYDTLRKQLEVANDLLVRLEIATNLQKSIYESPLHAFGAIHEEIIKAQHVIEYMGEKHE
jgi:hypothetical protein